MAVTTAFAGFALEDFEVFALEGFEPRMEALRGRLRPRLVLLAEALAPRLSDVADHALYPHVAAHLRRSVNPPPETWAAFGPDPRRYKALAHFAVGIDRDGLWLRLVLKDEALSDRQALARRLKGARRAYLGVLPPDMSVHTAAGVRSVRTSASDAEIARLGRKNEAQWAVGRDVARTDPAVESGAGVEALALDAFAAVLPLWRRLPSWPAPA
jgi:uncharacterized protein YktB (UPF0637 family)